MISHCFSPSLWASHHLPPFLLPPLVQVDSSRRAFAAHPWPLPHSMQLVQAQRYVPARHVASTPPGLWIEWGTWMDRTRSYVRTANAIMNEHQIYHWAWYYLNMLAWVWLWKCRSLFFLTFSHNFSSHPTSIDIYPISQYPSLSVHTSTTSGGGSAGAGNGGSSPRVGGQWLYLTGVTWIQIEKIRWYKQDSMLIVNIC